MNYLKNEDHSQHDVEIRPYFCGVIHDLVDFREVKTILRNILKNIT